MQPNGTGTRVLEAVATLFNFLSGGLLASLAISIVIMGTIGKEIGREGFAYVDVMSQAMLFGLGLAAASLLGAAILPRNRMLHQTKWVFRLQGMAAAFLTAIAALSLVDAFLSRAVNSSDWPFVIAGIFAVMSIISLTLTVWRCGQERMHAQVG